MVFFSWNSQMVSERNELDAENWREIAKIKAETGKMDLTSVDNDNIINQYENRGNSLHQSPGVD